MNYKLSQEFQEIQERNGLIENNTNGTVELLVNNVDTGATVNHIILANSEKTIYSLSSEQKLFARSVDRLTGLINVLPISGLSGGGSSSGGSVDSYSKYEIDQKIQDIKKNIPSKISQLQNDVLLSQDKVEEIINRYKN